MGDGAGGAGGRWCSERTMVEHIQRRATNTCYFALHKTGPKDDSCSLTYHMEVILPSLWQAVSVTVSTAAIK